MNLLQNLDNGKFGKFIASVRGEGTGLIHLIEDVETGFIKADPSLDKWREVAQDTIDDAAKVADDVEAVTQADPNVPINLTPGLGS